MRSLFAYILKNYFFFLFILLEIIAFSLVVQNRYQRAAFINSTNDFTGTVFSSYSNIYEYFHLKKTNDLLAEENTRLRNAQEQSFYKVDTLVYYQKDTLYRYINAKVISNSVSKQKNYLMLNKGLKHGIQKDMGVVTSQGIVGTVIEASDNFSMVISVLHLENKLSAKIEKNNQLGSLEWDGKNYRIGVLSDIPTHINLYKGDKIITSGNSHIFPEGIQVGTVILYMAQPNEKFNRAQIQYSVDYNNLYNVYVIGNMMKEELIKLEEEVVNE